MNVLLPRETVSDDACRLVQIHVEKGQQVSSGELLFTFESSKSVFDVSAEIDGIVDWSVLTEDQFYPVGEPIATISSNLAVNPGDRRDAAKPITANHKKRIASESMQARIADGQTLPELLDGLNFIGVRDLPSDIANTPVESGAELKSAGDDSSLKQEMRTMRSEMRHRYQRHVPSGTLLNDRWQLAREWGFGEGASCYDECLILGDVRVGRGCWIGPFTVLDGAHALLTIGDRSSIGAGTHIYTHDTIARTLVGDHVEAHQAATTIGNNCFIAPQAVIAPGTRLGDFCFVAAGAYVQGVFPNHSYIAGNPAIRAGAVELTENGFHIRRISESSK